MTLRNDRRRSRTGTEQFCTFHVGDLFFGTEADRVQEVLRSHEMTPIPLAPASIRGLINLRGQIVPALDTRRILGLDPRPDPQTSMNLILHTEDGAVSLLVDSIGDVLEVNLASYAGVPPNVPPRQRASIAGVYALANRLLLLLNPQQFMEMAAQ